MTRAIGLGTHLRCVLGAVPHGRIDILLPPSAALGAAYGFVVGAAAVGVRRLWTGRRSEGDRRNRPT